MMMIVYRRIITNDYMFDGERTLLKGGSLSSATGTLPRPINVARTAAIVGTPGKFRTGNIRSLSQQRLVNAVLA
jgi:predicted dinucleotide-utilizing enzyme